uniref:Protocadherin Fat 4-like n=1 Tax=Saccoglossus kowalevskii TaxID=10224 RepID=A0ABM0LVB1_SACKO|nr:PREDICTED: protocadherin Fat 4-like [Saccoglossus kowalevskii]
MVQLFEFSILKVLVTLLLVFIPDMQTSCETTEPEPTTTSGCQPIDAANHCGSNLYIFNHFEGIPNSIAPDVGDIRGEVPNGAIVNYTIFDGDASTAFTVDSNGVITQLKMLDREVMGTYAFTVTVIGCQFEKSIPVQVNLIDLNDETPAWSTIQYYAEWIDGTVAATTIAVLYATDDDLAENGEITYVVEPPFDDYFATDNNVVYNKNQLRLSDFQNDGRIGLNFDENEITVQVSAEDNGSEPKKAANTAKITIKITSQVEDGFENITLQSGFVYENQPNGTYITTIQSETSDDYEVIFEVAGTNELFQIDPISRNVTTTVQLDREVNSMYHLVIIGHMTDTTKCFINPIAEELIIHILDTNDNYPEFRYNTSSGSIAENSPPNTTVHMMPLIEATDADIDLNAAVVYSLSGDGSDQFQIDEITGIITTADNENVLDLDREIQDTYELTVTAADMGGDVDNLNTTISIVIYISDVNDNTPEFNETSYEFELDEDTPVNYVIGTLIAEDYDIGLNGRVLYSTVDGSHGDFDIDTYSGDLFVTGILDRESIPSYVINISAYDTGNPILESYTVVIIDILDINDNSPVFSSDLYIGSIEESAQLDSYVLTVRATDDDDGINANVSYYTSSSDFSIDPITGDITTNSTDYDFEDNGKLNYEFTVYANDQGIPALTSSSSVRVQILDSNDNAPQFTESAYYGNIDENSLSDTTVIIDRFIEVSDADTGLNAAIVYTLAGEGSDQFQIDNISGIITTSDNDTALNLDREAIDQYELVVTACDRNGLDGSLNTSAYLYIQINDVNDEIPAFDDYHNFTVSEHADIGHVVGRVRAFDNDTGINARLTYSVVSGSGGKFDVDPRNGAIFVASQLDREHTMTYILKLSVSDSGVNILQDFTEVEIQVLDVNDNSPTFTSDIYVADVEEELPSGTYLFTVTASDPDVGRNSNILFRLNTTDFAINDTTGDVLTTTVLDYEDEENRIYEFQVFASDQGEIPMTSSVLVKVYVFDTNDNAPIFTQHVYYGNIEENSGPGTTVIMTRDILASDVDQGLNSSIVYSISGNNSDQFRIDNKTGVLETSNSGNLDLDRETVDFYEIILTAFDRNGMEGSRNTSVFIHVTVNDDNDNNPAFEDTLYTFDTSEGANVGDSVGSIHADDEDIDINARLTYSVIGGSDGKFVVDADSGEILVASNLDRETKSAYTINMSVSDSGEVIRRNFTEVHIQVIDTNDNTPEFDTDFYLSNVEEELTSGTYLFTVTASDPDVGSNCDIVFSLDTLDFAINDTTGEISTSTSLDFEDEDNRIYEFYVFATDQGEPALTSSAFVKIQVVDINDNAPDFTEHFYHGNVDENSVAGTTVNMLRSILATDEDQGMNASIIYQLDGDGSDQFLIDERTGVMTTKTSSLDREVKALYELRVIAFDRDMTAGSLNTSVPVHITISDVNDNRPSFDGLLYYFTVREDAEIGYSIGNASAVDDDASINSRLTYSIIDGSGGKFNIHPNTGDIFVLSKLDRESEETYIINITVSDSGVEILQDFATVQIQLLDVNDNTPAFDSNIYVAEVEEELPSGTYLFTVTATDPDAGSNGDVSYSLNTTDFAVDEITGEVSINQSLDYEDGDNRKYTFQVFAADRGDVIKTSTAMIIIYVVDVNDNEPDFVEPVFYGNIDESSVAGTTVIMIRDVMATDLDNGPNASIIYSLDGGVPFSINERTGVITATGLLDREARGDYELTVTASDRDGLEGSRDATATVNVTVNDINDNSPEFLQSSYDFNVAENASIHTTIGVVHAGDDDIGINGRLTYILTSGGQGKFGIDYKTGEIFTLDKLDYENTVVYSLNVSVSDGGEHVLQDWVDVTIRVSDVNDNYPAFTRDVYVGNVTENLAVNSDVLTVLVTDADSFTNSDITFMLDTSNFQIDDQTVSVIVFAFDAGQPSLTSSALVRVTVLDTNDNAPIFSAGHYDTMIFNGMWDNYPVLVTHADDADSGDNGRISFRISDNTTDLFTVDTKGVVTITGIVNYDELLRDGLLDDEDALQFLVVAVDNGSSQLQNSTTVNVTVVNVELSDDAGDCVSDITGCGSNWYQFTIDEHSPAGTFVGNISEEAEHFPDSTYSVLEEYAVDVFNISDTGVIVTLTNNIDREENSTITFTVVIQFHQNATKYVPVVVVMLDINDNAPIFSPISYSAEVLEYSPAGTFIIPLHATDLDAGLYGTVYYVIQQDSFFWMDANNLRSLQTLVISDLVDAGILVNDNIVELDVYAIDGGNKLSVNNATINLNITQLLDDNNQTCLNTTSCGSDWYMFNVTEESSPGQFVGNISEEAYDISNPSYFILQDHAALLFKVHDEGVLVVGESRIDREEFKYIQLTIVILSETNTTIKYIPVHVDVVDINDNRPEFSRISYSVNISEHSPVDTFIVPVYATDADSGTNGEVSFYIAEPHNNTFWMDNNNLRSRYELILNDGNYASHQTIYIYAMDKGNVVSSVYASVDLLIHPYSTLNCNGTFQNGSICGSDWYRFTVDENSSGAVVGNISNEARGMDDPMYSVLQDYAARVFDIAGDGTISTSVNIDREINDTITFTVVITNRLVTISKYVYVHVDVIDVNDNVPVFGDTSYSANILEHSPTDTFITPVHASDLDAGSNGNVHYKVVLDNFFWMDGNNLRCTKKLVKQEMVDENIHFRNNDIVEVVIYARDGGGRMSINNATVWLQISTLAPDEQITFEKRKVRVFENQPNGTHIATVTTTAYPEYDVKYSFSQPNSTDFHINQTTGEVTTIRSLDREIRKTYEYFVKVYVEDDVVCLTDAIIAELNITVLDENDNHPSFSKTQGYHGEIMENPSYRMEVHMPHPIMSTDGDYGFNASTIYTLSGDGHEQFKIDGKTGVITATDDESVLDLDREKRDRYDLEVIVSDRDGVDDLSLSTSVPLTIVLLDVNDNYPQFSHNEYYYEIFENTTSSYKIGVISATDIDRENNAAVSFEIRDGSDGDFQINRNTGVLSVSNTIDRENKAQYILNISASDHGQPINTNFTRVVIKLLDVNDNQPIFKSTMQNSAYILEEEPIGGHVLTVIAEDPDDGLNGQIKTNKTFDYEDLSDRLHVFEVFAADNNEPYHVSTATVTVSVTDINDNTPVFTESEYESTVGDGMLADEVVVVVKATDADDGSVFYDLENYDSDFAIERNRGIVRTNRTINFDQICLGAAIPCIIDLNISATDDGNPPRSNYAIVHVQIEITDINDNNPVFTLSWYTGEVNEGNYTNMNTYILQVTATDTDIDENAGIEYSITDGNNGVFAIEPTTGYIYANSNIDREYNSSYCNTKYTMTVMAQDNGSPQLNSTTGVEITVLDVNDNVPKFNQSVPYKGWVEENALYSVDIVTVSATDDDEGDNARISYAIVSGGDDAVRINPDSGLIQPTWNAQIDYEDTEGRNYTLIIQATDAGNPPLSSKAIVHIYVIDVNDNTPYFMSNSYVAEVSMDEPVDYLVITVLAVDSDSGENGRITYTTNVEYFHLDNETGEITIQKELDTSKDFTFTVNASDNGTPVKWNTTEVTISVKETNIYAPVFDQTFYSLSVTENVPAGEHVVTVTATDRDAGNISLVEVEGAKFTITDGNDNGFFVINGTTGEIFTTGEIDRETAAYVNLEVTAHDGGTPPKNDTTVVQITIIDVNDEQPVIDRVNVPYNIFHDSPNGTFVMNVTASDPDEIGSLMFSLEHSMYDVQTSFDIDNETGAVTTTNKMMIQVYYLLVHVNDGVNNAKSEVFKVNVVYNDPNLNAPIFIHDANTSYNTTIPYDLQVYSTLSGLNIQAEDADEGSNGKVTYTMGEGNFRKIFAINATSASITTRDRLLPYFDWYNLTVIASDAGYKPKSSSVTVYIHVTDTDTDTTEEPNTTASAAESGAQTKTWAVATSSTTGILAAILVILTVMYCVTLKRKSVPVQYPPQLPPRTPLHNNDKSKQLDGDTGSETIHHTYLEPGKINTDEPYEIPRAKAMSASEYLKLNPEIRHMYLHMNDEDEYLRMETPQSDILTDPEGYIDSGNSVEDTV